jgi:tetratricopeptide (TPR) repeat protein
MSDSGKAVFLSYASQDAEAAKRICDALRAAGVEVWFDQSELVGGDAWDAKIRGQIFSCALFMPVISANTQARKEGYFRIEWRLAAQRTHAMSDDSSFLMPVVVDDTKDAEARVPVEFKAVQWTRFPAGETTPKFCARVKALLSEDQGAGSTEVRTNNQEPTSHGSGRATGPGSAAADIGRPNNRRLRHFWWALPILGVTIALVLLLQGKGAGRGPVPASPPAVADSEAWKLAENALGVTRSIHAVTREGLETADAWCKRALELDSLDGRLLAVAAEVDATWVYYQMDKSEGRRQQAENRAARAAVLAPNDPMTRFAQAMVYASVIGTPAMQAEAEKLFRGLVDSTPAGQHAKVMLGTLLRDMGRADEAAAIFEEIGDLDSAGWAYWIARRYDDVLRVADAALRQGHSTGALRQKFFVMMTHKEDLEAMKDIVAQFTPQDLLLDTVANTATLDARIRRDAARVLEIADAFPREYYSNPGVFAPKRYYTGWAHRFAGRPELAQGEWRAALGTLQELLRNKPQDPDLLGWQAIVQAWLGDANADASLRQFLSLLKEGERDEALATQMFVALGLGRREEAMQLLLRSAGNSRSAAYVHPALRFLPEFDDLRADPRFQKFLRDTLPPGAKPFDDAKPEASK